MQVCRERAEVLAARIARLVDAAARPRGPSASSRSCSSTSRRTPATPARPPTSRCSRAVHNVADGARRRRATRSMCRRRVDALRVRRSSRATPRRFGADRQRPHRASPPTTTSAASRTSRRSRRQWGPGPRPAAVGRRSRCSCSASRFGNVFVGVQPAFGYEGDPMRLLFEKELRADARLLGLLSLAPRGLRRPCGAAFRHPRRARVHARQAGRPRRPLTGPTG
jgi:magnesium chelatase subunit H